MHVATVLMQHYLTLRAHKFCFAVGGKNFEWGRTTKRSKFEQNFRLFFLSMLAFLDFSIICDAVTQQFCLIIIFVCFILP